MHAATSNAMRQVLNLLRRHYPPHIMPNLQRYSQAAMHDLSNAFPKGPSVDHTNLDRFLEVDCTTALVDLPQLSTV